MKFSIVSTTAALLFSSWSSAVPATETCLNILLTNDDGYDTIFIQTLFTYLKEQTCHEVVMVAPEGGQSGKGSSLDFFTPILSSGNPETDVYFLGSTPATTVYYGLDIICPSLYFVPDLIVSGPNEGWNIGLGGIPSGTIAAAQAAMVRGYPAIAVSASPFDAAPAATVIAGIMGRLIDEKLIDKDGELILKAGEGFNVNIPTVVDLTGSIPSIGEPSDYDFKLTKIGLAGVLGAPKYFNDFADCPIAQIVAGGALNGFPGLCAINPYPLAGYPEDNDRKSEGNAIGPVVAPNSFAPLPGFTVTVSPIEFTLEVKPTRAMKNAFKKPKSSKGTRRN